MSDLPAQTPAVSPWRTRVESVGRATVRGIEEIGYCGSLFVESFYWLIWGRKKKQPVRLRAIVAEMINVGITAIPIVTVLSLAVGMMLAMQGIYSLKIFGAESRVTFGVALGVAREFSPMITGILVAGRSGSALAARLGMMTINQEVDALNVMGINPVRFLVAPALVAMVIMLPSLTFFSELVSLYGAGLFVKMELGIGLSAFFDEVRASLSVNDVLHGVGKSAIFAILITLIGVANGAGVRGGAEGVGKVTTRAVVQSISAILVTDMLLVFLVTR